MPFRPIAPVFRNRRPGRCPRERIPSPALLTLGAVLGLFLAGCASSPPASFSSADGSPSCLVLPGPESEIGSGSEPPSRDDPITVGLTRPVDPRRAPVATNPDEAFLFALLYEPLVRLDCTGRVLPGLASSWEADDGGRRWTFTLRKDAAFQDGHPVTAQDVADSWRRVEESGRSPWATLRPLSVEVLDPRRLRVTFAESRAEPPAVLAGHALAVAGPGKGGDWPFQGTGPYRVDTGSADFRARLSDRPSAPSSTDPAPGVVREIHLRPTVPGHRLRLPYLRIRIEPGADPRDLLGAGADLVVTSDPATREYADLRPELVHRPLPWSRRYRLAVPEPGIGAPTFLLGELARDAVREEARPARATPDDGCGWADSLDPGPRTVADPRPGAPSSPRGGRPPPDAAPRGNDDPRLGIGFQPGDPTARALAERLVALAVAAGPDAPGEARIVRGMLGLTEPAGRLVAFPVQEEEAGSGEIGRVISLPLRRDGACRTVESAPGPGHFLHRIPLVETRERVFVRAGRIRLVVDGFGTPHPVGRSR